MTETFRIKFEYGNNYRIVQQPKRDFSCRIGDMFVASASYPCADSSNIYLRGTDLSRDDWLVKLYTGHLKVLEELCRRQHWRFVACLY